MVQILCIERYSYKYRGTNIGYILYLDMNIEKILQEQG